MVSLEGVRASNATIATALPAGLVAVFVGATSGIGEGSLKAFAQHAAKPRIYFVGRSQEAAERIVTECKALNGEASVTFVKADISLMQNVDAVCEQIKSLEKEINLLFLSAGQLTLYDYGRCLPCEVTLAEDGD